jgi:hypothetical protein
MACQASQLKLPPSKLRLESRYERVEPADVVARHFGLSEVLWAPLDTCQL